MEVLSTQQLEQRVEELLEAQGFEDADEWGPNGKGCIWWALDIERAHPNSALASLVAFLEELAGSSTEQAVARNIIGDGHRTLKMMHDLLDVRNTLVAERRDDQIDRIVTRTTSVQDARKRLKALFHPPSAFEERTTKRQRKQVERPGYVNILDPGLSCASNSIPVRDDQVAWLTLCRQCVLCLGAQSATVTHRTESTQQQTLALVVMSSPQKIQSSSLIFHLSESSWRMPPCIQQTGRETSQPNSSRRMTMHCSPALGHPRRQVCGTRRYQRPMARSPRASTLASWTSRSWR